MTIRLVLFDAFSTLLVPKHPVHVQYAQTFEPYLGTLDPDAVKKSFKIGRYTITPYELPASYADPICR